MPALSRVTTGSAHRSQGWLANHPRFARLFRDFKYGVQSTFTNAWAFYSRQNLILKGLILLAVTSFFTAEIVFLIYHERVFEFLVSFATSWRELRAGPAIMFGLIVLISFPPLIGYSLLSSMCGMMYGFWGWPLLASATILGSLLSFLACRYVFHDYAQRLASSNEKFAALTSTMEQDGFKLLWMIRLCPLPYSISNGALASIPSVSPLKFTLATALTSPKLLMHIFVGDRLMHLSSETDTASRVINIISIAVASIVGSLTAYTIYTRTIEKTEQNDEAYHGLELDVEANGSTSLDEFDRDSFDINDDFEPFEGTIRNKSAY